MQNQRLFGRGVALLYVTVALIALFAVVSLSVDWGRVQWTRTRLQATADAAARYAVAGLKNDIGGVSAAFANAQAVCLDNSQGAETVTVQPEDVVSGVWNANTRTFTPNTNVNVANAVKVTLHRTKARNNPVPLAFARLIGRADADVKVEAIAVMVYNIAANAGAGNGRFDYYIPATSNPWLSGMPKGSIASVNNPANNPDYAGDEFTDDGKNKKYTGTGGEGSSDGAGTNESNWSKWGDYSKKKSSPIKAGNIPIQPGATMTFDGINGGANNFSSSVKYTADGNLGWVIDNWGKNENGMSNIRAPINSVIAVFLSDAQPNQMGAAPPMLDFSSASSRDFHTLEPQLRQVFFIGDGRRSTGEVQRFVIPPGATRLYLGTMDGWEWSNNIGGFNVSAHVSGTIMVVR